MKEINKKLFVIHFHNIKAIKFLETLGHVSYFSKKRKYAYLYVTHKNFDELVSQIKKHRAIKFVESSLLFDNQFNPNNIEISE